MDEVDTLEALKSMDPDSYREMCEIGATPIHEIEASLCEYKLQPSAELRRELRRLLRPTFFRRLTVRLAAFDTLAKDCFLSFFFMPPRKLIAFSLLLYFFASPLLFIHNTSAREPLRLLPTEQYMPGQYMPEQCIKTMDSAGEPYLVPINQRSVGVGFERYNAGARWSFSSL